MEVAGIWIEDENRDNTNSKKWDIRVYSKSGRSHRVQYYFRCYDPLQYVLIFPNDEPDWHCNIPRVGYTLRHKQRGSHMNISNFISFEELIEREQQGFRGPGIDDSLVDTCDMLLDENRLHNHRGKRKKVSCREYYVYKLQDRENDKSYILRFGRLFQQYVFDKYIKIESMHLDFLRSNQNKTKSEYYQGVIDSIISGVVKGGRVSKRVYLSHTFIGGPMDMRHRYLDFMALVQEFGRPDLFITLTCNPN
ncbi:hypothetical protein LIER_17308 [Lithospermum erythrorhizon]|uniref:Helitron helicase-like domain-containing protein n=1 Tax=Lithospermum erythrorhizon TaxID=34254 RepID=A0AAV3QD44_LITER